MSVTKKEFAVKLAVKGNLKKAEAYRMMDLFIETLIDCFKEDTIVKFQEFGRFELKTVKEYVGRNPKTKQEHTIPEHKKVKFYASEKLKNRIEER